jgi:hypothetical protein
VQSLFDDTTTTDAGDNGESANNYGREIEDIFKRIAEGATPTTTVDTEALRSKVNGIDAALALLTDKVGQLSQPKADRFVVQIGGVEREIPERAHKVFGALLKLCKARKPETRGGFAYNILLVGPAGCGKTYAAQQVADALDLPFGFLSLSGGISESFLLGRYVPTGENGRFEYTPAPFVESYRSGGVFLLDEIDAADPNVLVVVNAALANGSMRLPDGSVAKRHADFVCIGAANTYGNGADRQYVGRNQLDTATLDRFAACRLQVDYDTDLERSASRPDVCEWALTLRDKARDAKLRRVVSTRFIFDASDLVDAGAATLEDVKRSLLLDWTDAELASVSEVRP